MASSRRSSSTPIITVGALHLQKAAGGAQQRHHESPFIQIADGVVTVAALQDGHTSLLFSPFLSPSRPADILASILTLFSEIARVRFSAGQPAISHAEYRTAILPGLQHPDVAELLRRGRQGVPVQTTRSARSPRARVPLSPSSKYWYAAFAVTAAKAADTSTRSFGPRTLPDRVTRITAHQTVSRNVRREHRRVGVEGEGDPQRRRGACGADARRPLRPQVLQMDVAPVVHMGPRKRRGSPPSRRTSGTWSRPSSWAWIITGRMAVRSTPSRAAVSSAARYCAQAASPLQWASSCMCSAPARRTISSTCPSVRVSVAR